MSTMIERVLVCLIALAVLALAIIDARAIKTAEKPCAECIVQQLVCVKRDRAPACATQGPCLHWQSAS